MKRNLPLYKTFILLNDPGLTWPIHFLLMLQFISLQQILLLQAIQQILVVALEVPTGIISDRFGRKPTLLISAIAGFCCFASWIFADSFSWFLLANVLWALTASFLSGADSSFHYDTLEALNRESEFQKREATLKGQSLFLQASLAVIGGWLYAYNDRLPFVIACILGATALVAVVFFKEPPRHQKAIELTLFHQLKDISFYFQRPLFVWIMGFAALSTVLDFLPYQYYQPYLDLVGQKFSIQAKTSVITGWHASITMVLGATAVGIVPWLLSKYKASTLLLCGSWIHLILVLLMSFIIHPTIGALLVFREVPNSLKAVIIPSLVLPHVRQFHRATVLSLINFSSKLAVASVFIFLASVKGVGVYEQMSRQLQWAGAGCLLLWFYLFWRLPREVAKDVDKI